DGEQAVIGRDGQIYVNSEDTAEVVVFDPKSLEVTHRFPIGVAKVPTGLAYDPKTNRLFIGCRNEPKMVVMDAASGKVITTIRPGRHELRPAHADRGGERDDQREAHPFHHMLTARGGTRPGPPSPAPSARC